MMINLWPLLLPAAAWSGWWMARRGNVGREKNMTNQLSREYVVGLNYLLNEQPDKAVDVFIKLLEVDSETVETHLALGSLFRRRGEVDRAIRIHQNLIARPQLSLLQRKEALMALGQDYMSAGVFDRAERIFLEVVELGDAREVSSLRGLLAIYQQEKAWEKALEVIKKLYPNVDFYSGLTLSAIGIPTNMFTVIFALARTVGWMSHWLEMTSGPFKIGRPRQLYTGQKQRDV